MRRRRAAIAFVIAVGAAGCKNDSAGPQQVTLIVFPAVANLAAGASQQFTASAGNASVAVTWTVNGVTGGNTTLGTITRSGLYTAPGGATNVTVSAISQTQSSLSASASVHVLSAHRIGTRATSTIAEFFDRTTGQAFVPRGNNYVRLATQTWRFGGPPAYQSALNVGVYDAQAADSALVLMQAEGFNIVRLWLNGCCAGNTLGDANGGLSAAYLANVVDFLQRAKSHGVFAILTIDWVPLFGGYIEMYGNCAPNFNVDNTLNLCPGGVAANVAFFHDLATGLIAQQAPLDAVFAFELRNEYYYDSDQPPLSLSSGTVTTADGQAYDMSSASSRQQMLDNGLIYFTNTIRTAIVAIDPTALVSVGFFVPQGPVPTRVGDTRVISVYPMIASSTADFVDLHPYALAGGLTLAQYAQNFGFTGYQQQKPIIMGEFGELQSDYPMESMAATIAHDWQVQSCTYGFKGWVWFTWDTSNQEYDLVGGPRYWSAALGSGLIAQTLSPAARPDPCAN